jgi:hypothetical protein
MEWYNYLACFFAGAFLSNAVPHFVAGVQGNKFPSPFANPPGKGLSSAMVNVVWGLFNMIVGYLLLKPGHVQTEAPLTIIVFFAGVAALAIMAGNNFTKKDKE